MFEAMDELSCELGTDGLPLNYDEQLLKKRLGNKISTNQLHVTKNYLYGLILKSLRAQHEKFSTEEQLAVFLAEARVLEQRGLYEQLHKKLTSAKNLAFKFEKQLALIEIFKLEILRCAKQKMHGVEEELTRLYDNLFKQLHLLEAEIKYRKLQNELTAFYRKNVRARDEPSRLKIELLGADISISEEAAPQTFLSKIYCHYSRALISILLGKVLEGVQHYRKMMDVWTGYPHFKAEYPSTFIIYSSNYLVGCHNVRDYSAFPAVLEDLKNTPTRNFDEAAEAFQNIYFLEQLYFMNHKMFSIQGDLLPHARNLAAKIHKGLETYAPRIVKARQMSFYHNTTIMFFALGDHDMALDWISKVQQSAKTDQRKEIQLFARLLQLIIFTEKGEHLYIDNAFKAFEYHLKKEDRQHDFEGKVTHFLKQLVAGKQDHKTLLTSFQNELKQFEPLKIPGHEEITIWVESKIQNKTFFEVLKNRVESSQKLT